MDRQHVPRGALLTSNLPQLQNLIKRDPAGYKEEFLQQWNHYESIRKIFVTSPDEQAGEFRGLVGFIAQVRFLSLMFPYGGILVRLADFILGRTMLSKRDGGISSAAFNLVARELCHVEC